LNVLTRAVVCKRLGLAGLANHIERFVYGTRTLALVAGKRLSVCELPKGECRKLRAMVDSVT
jgi:hypothetical protein